LSSHLPPRASARALPISPPVLATGDSSGLLRYHVAVNRALRPGRRASVTLRPGSTPPPPLHRIFTLEPLVQHAAIVEALRPDPPGCSRLDMPAPASAAGPTPLVHRVPSPRPIALSVGNRVLRLSAPLPRRPCPPPARCACETCAAARRRKRGTSSSGFFFFSNELDLNLLAYSLVWDGSVPRVL